ncbi:efflux RND transporter periplasmic adaptor subunit [Isosphaeraceae bacterium EP7]
MASTLRDDLASLKIDRGDHGRGSTIRQRDDRPGRPARRRGFGSALLGWSIWLVPLGLLAGGGFYAYREYEKIRTKVEVNVGVVSTMTSGEAEKLLSAKGYLKSRNQAMIGTKFPGRVQEMRVEEGSKVKKGDLLAVLEHRDMEALLESKKAEVLKADAELLEARADLKDKDRKAKRMVRLRSLNGAASLEEVEQADTAREMGEARVAALEAAAKLLRANVAECEDNIRQMSFYAPFDGTVVEKQGEVGEVITSMSMSSSTGRSAVVTLANLDRMEVDTDVNEALLSRVVIGQPAEVSVSAVAGKHYRGRLRQIIPMGDRARGTVKVKVEILDPDASLFPELGATVHFLPDKGVVNPDAGKAFLFLPKAAIVEETGHWYAWVIDDKDEVRRRGIEVVLTNDDLARVESGVKAGDRVVLNPTKALRDGERVSVAR